MGVGTLTWCDWLARTHNNVACNCLLKYPSNGDIWARNNRYSPLSNWPHFLPRVTRLRVQLQLLQHSISFSISAYPPACLSHDVSVSTELYYQKSVSTRRLHDSIIPRGRPKHEAEFTRSFPLSVNDVRLGSDKLTRETWKCRTRVLWQRQPGSW